LPTSSAFRFRWHLRETGNLGAAVAAGTAAGLFADFRERADAMAKAELRNSPNPGLADLYGQRYRIYQDISDAMTPIWKRMAALGAAA
jgi:L-xylulokinase